MEINHTSDTAISDADGSRLYYAMPVGFDELLLFFFFELRLKSATRWNVFFLTGFSTATATPFTFDPSASPCGIVAVAADAGGAWDAVVNGLTGRGGGAPDGVLLFCDAVSKFGC